MSSHMTWMKISGPIGLEGDCYKPVPLDRFLAQVKVFEAEGDTA